MKFGRLLERADALGFDFLATGHHARVAPHRRRRVRAAPGRRSGQGPVLRALHARPARARPHAPAGRRAHQGRGARARDPARAADRAEAREHGRLLHHRGGREAFLSERVAARAGAIVDTRGTTVGAHDGVANFTVGQRRGLGVAAGERRYVVDVDARPRTVTVGRRRGSAPRRDRRARPRVRRRSRSCRHRRTADRADPRARRAGRRSRSTARRSASRRRSRGWRRGRWSRCTTATRSSVAGSLPDRDPHRQPPTRGQAQHLVAPRQRDPDLGGRHRLAAAASARRTHELDLVVEPDRHRARARPSRRSRVPGVAGPGASGATWRMCSRRNSVGSASVRGSTTTNPAGTSTAHRRDRDSSERLSR